MTHFAMLYTNGGFSYLPCFHAGFQTEILHLKHIISVIMYHFCGSGTVVHQWPPLWPFSKKVLGSDLLHGRSLTTN